MTYNEIFEHIRRSQGLTIGETEHVIAEIIGRSVHTVHGYRCDSKTVPAWVTKLLNAIFN